MYSLQILLVFRRDNVQVLQFDSSLKMIQLLVLVTNLRENGKLAEDAHQTELTVTIPNALKYSAVRSDERPLEVSRSELLWVIHIYR